MFEKYDAYKDSGIQWIGQIPEHWEIEKAKWIFLKADRPIRPNDGIVTCFRDGEVTLRSNRRTDGFTNALKEHGYQGIRKGDLVIHAMDAFAGAIGVSDSDGKSTPVYSACIPRIKNRINVHYYAYYLRNLALAGFIESLAKGIRERSTDFRFADFAELLLPFPKLEDQERIVAFLNQKTAEIEQAIAIKEQQIALLNERKQIVIQKAVTQGLDPNVPMKDSGVEWIGQIPEHWHIKKLKYLAQVEGGFAFSSDLFKEDGVQLLKISNLYMNILSLDRQPTFIDEKYINTYSKWVVSKGDILMSLTGTLGKKDYGFAILLEDDSKFFLNQRVGKISFNTDVNNFFILNQLQSDVFLDQIYQLPSGTKQANLSNEHIENAYLIIPNLNEQKQISHFITGLVQATQILVENTLKEIGLLKEYKTTLINDAVTGKIKVA